MEQATLSRRFSVLIPVFNRPDLVRLTIDSVLAQTFTDYEVIVVDDGSTDNTVEVLRTYGTRIKLVQQANGGAEAARSNAASVASGEYLVLLDSDDLLYPTSLASYDRIIRGLQSPPVILGAMSYFSHGTVPATNPPGDEGVQYVRFRDFLAKDRTAGLSCSCIVVKGTVAASARALRPKRSADPFEGNDIMLLLGTCEPCIQLTRPFTVAYRVHDTNVSRRLDYLITSASCLVRFERLGQYPGGAARRFDRFAYVGGVVWAYASRGLRRGLFKISLRLLFLAFPMVAVGVINSIRRRFRPRLPTVTLAP